MKLNISIQKSKSGEDTAIADGHFLHSNFTPVKDAERSVQNLKLPYLPKKIIILEPCLSYTADFLRQAFPQAQIGAIRYEKAFEKYNSKFDFVINYIQGMDFESYLEQAFNEEELLSAYFISWTPSAQIYADIDKKLWKAIKAALERAKTLLITRQYFEKKWLLNSCNFIKNVKTSVNFNSKISKDLLIISSGPSLKPFIKFIAENQKKFFIICLSSAISLCIKNDIKPDLCMTTDGGYWAGQHLKKLAKCSLPLAMSAEAYCPKDLLQKLKILPLNYGDGLSKELLESSGLPYKTAVRNGTVSGTALFFAVQHASKNIFMCGLDLAKQMGFHHSQPNELELNNSLFDNRIKNKESRMVKAELNPGSLEIYRSWFSANEMNLGDRKVIRLIQEKDRKNNLGWIKDFNLSDFEKYARNLNDESSLVYEEACYEYDSKKISSLFSDDKKIEKWKRQLFPLDYVSLSHNTENIEIQNKIDEEWENLKNKISGLLYDNL